MFLLKNSTRREIKFKVFIKDVGKLYSWILKSSFKKSFSNRGVNSLYYDTPNLDFANENIIGLSKRIKIRARWYSNNDKNFLIEFCKQNSNAQFFESLGQLNYFSIAKQAACVIGNSSSGLLEAPSLKIPTINIGDRQKGRLQASSVINCRPERPYIEKAIKKLYSKRFLVVLKKTISPYGKGGASKKIVKIIKNLKSDGILKKQFFDLNQ